jgi:hypothetical protein
MDRSVLTDAERTILADGAYAAFVLDLDVGLADRIRHCFIALLGGLAKRDFLDDAGLLGDHSFFVMLFGFDGAIDEGVLGSSQRTIDSAASDFGILVAKREIFANRGLGHVGTNPDTTVVDVALADAKFFLDRRNDFVAVGAKTGGLRSLSLSAVEARCGRRFDVAGARPALGFPLI